MKPKSYYSDPLGITRAEIESERRFEMRIARHEAAVWQRLAADFCSLIRENEAAGQTTRVILLCRWLDVGPLAANLNAERINCRRLVVFHPEEFCDEGGQHVSPEHPLSLSGRMWRQLYGRLDPELRPPRRNVVFPDPRRPGEFGARISDAGGAQACYAALGMDAHFGFQTQPRAGEPGDDEYFDLPARVVDLAPEALGEAAQEAACDSVTAIPPKAVCGGLGDIMRSAAVRLFLGHRWQAAALRRVFYGPVTPRYPASILQRHPEVQVTMAPEVAELPGRP